MLIGAYHYARYDLNTGTAGATSEANAFWSIAGPYIKGGGYYIMPMLDVEASFTGYTATTLCNGSTNGASPSPTAQAVAGVPGIKPCIYCSSSHAASYLDTTVTQWNTDIADWAWAPGDHAGALAGAQASASPPAGMSHGRHRPTGSSGNMTIKTPPKPSPPVMVTYTMAPWPN